MFDSQQTPSMSELKENGITKYTPLDFDSEEEKLKAIVINYLMGRSL